MTGQSNSSQGRGHDHLPNWNPKNGGMLISQPVTSCLTNHSELCMSHLLNNQSRRISIYRLQRQPSLGFESSVSSVLMTSDDPVDATLLLGGISSSQRLYAVVLKMPSCYFLNSLLKNKPVLTTLCLKKIPHLACYNFDTHTNGFLIFLWQKCYR